MVNRCRLILAHLASICIVLLLNACATTTTNINSRPDDWASAEVAPPLATCPDISGVYEDNVEDCVDSYCLLLNAFLFRIDYPFAERVEIRLLSDETLKIIGKWSGAETKIVLSRHNGDFECGPDGLFVTGGDGSFFAGWAALGIVNETRTFNRCSDGSLVMKLDRKMHGNIHPYPIAPFSTHEVNWARWKAAPALD